MPKVSIIIPIYNVEKYLDKCVQSAISQTLQDIEIILVDDESPDNCPQLCDEYAIQDSRIKVVHKKNGGLGFARNSGLEVATGEYVTFLDSDDFVDLFTYEHLYNLVQKNNLDAIYYKYTRFTKEDDVVACQPDNNIIKYCDEDVKELMLDIIASEPDAKVDRRIQCSSCTAIYKLGIIKDYCVLFHSEREIISEDMVFNLDYLNYAQRVAFNDGVHYHYRVNPISLTSTVRTDRFNKNLIMYNFLINKLSHWGLNSAIGKERCQRFLIGYSRTAISQFLCSSKSKREKNEWLDETLSSSIWKELYKEYAWKKLPLYPRYFFKFCAMKNTVYLFMLCRIKKLITR